MQNDTKMIVVSPPAPWRGNGRGAARAGKGSGGKFGRGLKARESAPQGLESVEGLGIRSWEVILTYADTLHSYRFTVHSCTHECYDLDFILHIGRQRAHSSIVAATALL